MDTAAAIGAVLPLAAGVALSPVPIIAVILMLVSARGAGSALAFLAGWVPGVALPASVAAVVAGSSGADDDRAGPWVAVVTVLLGAALLVLAVRQVRRRVREGEPELPAWLARIDTMTPAATAGLGLALAGANPKNLALGLAAGSVAGDPALEAGAGALVVVVFVALGSASVGLPVLARLVTGDRLVPTLDRLRRWLTRNNSTIVTVLLAVIGLVLVGQGLGEL